MDNFSGLLEDFKKLTKNSSKFKKTAFHVHSPQSYDWGREGDPEVNTKQLFLENKELFLDKLAENFDLVCITDHMKTSYACELAEASLQRDDITVFPGMEVNCILGDGLSDRIHILVIFPPDKSVSGIERIFSANPIDDEIDRDGKEDFILEEQSLSSWANMIEKNDGIMILAHIDQSSRGHRAHFRSMMHANLKMFIKDADEITIDEDREIAEFYKSIVYKSSAHAIEVLKPENKQHYIEFETDDGKKGRMPCILRSDYHTVEELKNPEYVTHIKVSNLDFKHVKDALRFFETRIKFGDQIPEDPPNKILGVRLVSPSEKGLFNDAKIGFSNNLNCLIGPRGSGKSTLIEALRYVFGQNSTLIKSSGNENIIDYSDLALKIQSSNLEDTLIEVLYQGDDDEIKCLRTAFDKEEEFNTDVFTIEGDKIEMGEGGVEDNFPVRIFSWGEIENLGRQPQLQRDLIDRQINEMPKLKNLLSDWYHTLKGNTQNILTKCKNLNHKIQEDDSKLLRFNEYKSEFDRLNTPEISELFENLDTLRAKKGLIDEAKNKLVNFKNSILEVDEIQYEEFKSEVINKEYNELYEWWSENINAVIEFSDLEDKIDNHFEELIDLIDEKISFLEQKEKELKQKIARKEESIRAEIESESDEEIKAQKRENAKARYEAAKQKKEDYDQIYSDLESLLEKRNTILKEIKELKDQIRNKRENSQQTLNEELNELRIHGDIISVNFSKNNDKEEFIKYLRDTDFLHVDQFGKYKLKRLAYKFSLITNPINLGDYILNSNEENLLEARSELLEEGIELEDVIDEEDCETIVSHFNPLTRSDEFDGNQINTEKMEKVLKLQEVNWDDEINILLDDSPVDKLSPGQRSSAMLPLIALSEQSPLIIDQPEDNLDNRMVGRTLNKVLADLKEKRQIIVATHNPNIVVGGDAEQVIVTDAVSKNEAEVKEMGSIDEENIVEYVIDLMEGGKEAFKVRSRRYEKYL